MKRLRYQKSNSCLLSPIFRIDDRDVRFKLHGEKLNIVSIIDVTSGKEELLIIKTSKHKALMFVKAYLNKHGFIFIKEFRKKRNIQLEVDDLEENSNL